MVYHIMCGYAVCVLECCGSVCCASQLRWEAQQTVVFATDMPC
jgi:hypothetical protein